jgi:hypothetical protein
MKPSPLLTHLPIAPGYLKPLVTPEFIRTNIQEADALLGGFPKGGITEIYGPPSSGRTTLLLSFLQSATSQGEHCALIDASNSFDPQSAQKSGVDLKRLLWIRCPADNDKTRMEQALKCGDMLAHGGGWGAIILDLSDISPQWIHRLPVSYWYRFRRAVEHSPTVMVVMEREAAVKTCASLAVEMMAARPVFSGTSVNFKLLKGAAISLAGRKPARPQKAEFQAVAVV